MGKHTNIEWTRTYLPDGTYDKGHTWNPWRGCHKVSPGCKNCYMFREQRRWGHQPDVVVKAKPATFRAPLNWPGGKVFTCSWSDFFLEEADEWRGEAWDIIRRTPRLTYLILTKRVELVSDRLPPDWGTGWPNVWLMASAENQEWLERRAGFLRIPAVLHGLSLEPLLGPVDLTYQLANNSLFKAAQYAGGHNFHGERQEDGSVISVCDDGTVLHDGVDPAWLIIGGESDRVDPRPMELDWVHDLIDQCRKAGVAVFVKQLGSAWARKNGARDWKGADPSEWPPSLRVREFPAAFAYHGVGGGDSH